MEQTHLYHFLGVESDPLYQEINSIQLGEKCIIGEFTVLLSKFNLYELSSPSCHQAFSSKDACYENLCKLLLKQ